MRAWSPYRDYPLLWWRMEQTERVWARRQLERLGGGFPLAEGYEPLL